MEIKQGWLTSASICVSSHFNERPLDSVIDLIVIHNISLPPGKFGADNIKDFFSGQLDATQDPYFETIKNLQVSAHLLIDRAGEVTQFVPFDKRAWHAGKSSWKGRDDCNDFSIGIELEGSDDIAFTDNQYAQLLAVIALLKQVYSAITNSRIVGHSDIAPGRKTDPGPCFDWTKIRQSL